MKDPTICDQWVPYRKNIYTCGKPCTHFYLRKGVAKIGRCDEHQIPEAILPDKTMYKKVSYEEFLVHQVLDA